MTTIHFYTRPGCSLCEEALDDIERVRQEIPFELVEVDINKSKELEYQYGHRVPVGCIGDRVLFEYFVDAPRLREILKEEKEKPA